MFTGLSACYSQLPSSACAALRMRDDEFHKIFADRALAAVPELREFHSALVFCNAVGFCGIGRLYTFYDK